MKKKLVSLSVSESFHRMFEQQMKLQHDLVAKQEENQTFQMELQKEFIEKQSEKKLNHVNLPKIETIHFNGNKIMWPEFWDSFESAVHKNESLSEVDKFNYLRGKLTGEAREAIAGLSLSNENYLVAVKLLNDRFGDKQEIVDLHYNKLINIAPARNTMESLRFFLDKVERHLRSLEVLGENVNQSVFVSMIQRKIPSEVRLQLEMLKVPETAWTVPKLRDLLRRYIVSKEKAGKQQSVDSTRPLSWTKPEAFKPVQKKPFYSGRRYDTLSKPTETLVASEK